MTYTLQAFSTSLKAVFLAARRDTSSVFLEDRPPLTSSRSMTMTTCSFGAGLEAAGADTDDMMLQPSHVHYKHIKPQLTTSSKFPLRSFHLQYSCSKPYLFAEPHNTQRPFRANHDIGYSICIYLTHYKFHKVCTSWLSLKVRMIDNEALCCIVHVCTFSCSALDGPILIPVQITITFYQLTYFGLSPVLSPECL